MYKIKKNHDLLAVFKDDKLEAYGFGSNEDALHAIWRLNGANPEHFYKCNDQGEVYLDKTP